MFASGYGYVTMVINFVVVCEFIVFPHELVPINNDHFADCNALCKRIALSKGRIS